MGNHHINSSKEEVLRILSTGANRACDNIQHLGLKGRNFTSFPLEEELLFLSNKGGIWKWALSPLIPPTTALFYSPKKEGVARLVNQLPFIKPPQRGPLLPWAFGLSGRKGLSSLLLVSVWERPPHHTGSLFPTLLMSSPSLLYLHLHLHLHLPLHLHPILCQLPGVWIRPKVLGRQASLTGLLGALNHRRWLTLA